MDNVIYSPGTAFAPVFNWLIANYWAPFAAISTVADAILDTVALVLLSPPPLVVAGVVTVAALLTAGLRIALLCGLGLLTCICLDMWQETVETTALTFVAVLLSLGIGIPLGILLSRRRMLEVGPAGS
jgi:glycine betaine/proline transport system permease protein